MSVVFFIASIPSPYFREMVREEPKVSIGGFLCFLACFALIFVATALVLSFLRFRAYHQFVVAHGLEQEIRTIERLDRKAIKMHMRLEAGTPHDGETEVGMWNVFIDLYVRGMKIREVLPEQFHRYLPPLRHTMPVELEEEPAPSE